MWIALAVVGGLFVLVLLWFVAMYNGLVSKKVAADNGWAQIDVQLKRRYDLIPNLVETVKGYAAHEKGTLEAVIAARNSAVQITGGAESAAAKAQAEGVVSAALGRLFALAEAYPDLKANTSFTQLQEELASTENKIGFARQHFNDTVGRYEESRQSFPTNLIAAAFNFGKRDYFEVASAAEREAPKVSFT